MFPNYLDETGFPTDAKPTITKLTAYNGTSIAQHGICSIPCSYDDNKTEAEFENGLILKGERLIISESQRSDAIKPIKVLTNADFEQSLVCFGQTLTRTLT